nr:ABC transporter permease [Desulfobacterales bacterium]
MAALWVFIKRGFLTTFSYRLASALMLAGMFIGVIQYGFMAKFLKEGNTFPLLAPYGGDIMAYLITGSMFMAFLGVSLNSFSGTIRQEQMMGTLEYLLLSRTPLPLIMINSALWNFLMTCFNTVLIFLVIILVFGMKLSVNALASLQVLILSIVCISGIGLMSAGVILVTKHGDPITWGFSTLTGLLSGVIFPVQVLPNFLRKISAVLPPTYALRAIRKAVIVNAGFSQLRGDILSLSVMSLVTLSLGYYLFRWGFNRARRDGSLAEY